MKMEDEKLIEEVLAEDQRRRQLRDTPYDPESGLMSPGTRFDFECRELQPSKMRLPIAMRELPEVQALMRGRALTQVFAGSIDNARQQWFKLRCRYDFPFWAFKTIRIKLKGDGGCLDGPFLLNAPQRKLIGAFEKMREEGKPIRIVLVKARQWGGSTATQMYMLWIQLMRKLSFNSLIIGHQNSSTEEVITMAKRALDAYPRYLLTSDHGETLQERDKMYVSGGLSRSAIHIPIRNFRIKAGSAERPDSSRGGDYSLVHLTEVGLWRKTKGKSPEDIIRAATSGVLLRPETMIVMESTANGVGTFFHREYEAAKRGASSYRLVFVAWYEIDKYTTPVADRRAMAIRLVKGRNCTYSTDDRYASGAYLWNLWEAGASLEAIAWYEETRAGCTNTDLMCSEFPSTDEEAFVNSGAHVFHRKKALQLKMRCMPARYSGELVATGDTRDDALHNITFEPDPRGNLKIWDMPEVGPDGESREVYDRYLTVVDVGGRSVKADWSVVAVFDRIRMADGAGGVPAIVAQWRGHCDIDLLAWNAARIAKWYGNSLLVIESNTLETRDRDRYVDGDQSAFILNQLRDCYRNLYSRRQSPEDIRLGTPRKYGFHTNVSTKPMVISNLVRVVREGLYIERDEDCINEYLTYERRPNGSYGAISGKHDDLLMTRAIGLHVCYNEMVLPQRIHRGDAPQARRTVGSADEITSLRRTLQQSLF